MWLHTCGYDDRVSHSRIDELELPFFPGKLNRGVLIYVPEVYDREVNSKHYPTLYLLHGSPKSPSN